MQAVNLEEKLTQFTDHWAPRVVADFNGHDVMVVKVKGPFTWHSHPDTDDFFLVLRGRIRIRMPDKVVELNAGELFVVPQGVEHCPEADEEAELLIIEPHGTPNTGDENTAVSKLKI
jgi:mannose-6-phosphate isomerase-like protein (cupin superfamily)